MHYSLQSGTHPAVAEYATGNQARRKTENQLQLGSLVPLHDNDK